MRHLLAVALALIAACSSPQPPSYPVHREVVLGSGPIAILGEVQRPGTVAYRPGLRLVEALARSGGFTVFARKRGVRLRWQSPTGTRSAIIDVDAILEHRAPDPELLPGDEVFVDGRYL